jgi:diguanylate cyclase (GGDEF)-like protein
MRWLARKPDGAIFGAAAQEPVWFSMVALIVGALPFAFAPNIVEYPRVAGLSLASLAVASLLLLLRPLSRWPAVKRHGTSIVLLLAFATALAYATGKGHSPLLVLYLLPLAAAGWASGRRVWVGVCAVAVAALGCGLGALTPDMAPFAREFAVLLVSLLLPGVTVALALAHAVQQTRATEERLKTLAGTDPLTGFANLKAFEEVLQQQHRRAERQGLPYSILIIHVNDITVINESMGHNAGNQLIVAVAQAINRSVRQHDTAARLGGNEFIVLLTETDAPKAAQVAQRMRNHVYQGTISIGKRLLRASVSIGSAQFPDDHLNPKDLMILADQRTQADRELRREQATA